MSIIVSTSTALVRCFLCGQKGRFDLSKICAFFGHRDTPYTIALENRLEQTVRQLISQGVDEFWCCEQGTFDWMARSLMLKLKKEFHHITICYICAYRCSKSKLKWLAEHFDIIYPDEVANGLLKFAIPRRNSYIINNADIIICYVNRKSGGAYRAMQFALRKGKTIINLTSQQ